MKVDVLAAMILALHEKRMGDVAVLKAVASEPHENPVIRERVKGFMDLNLKRVDMAELAAMPKGTFGRAYSDFMRRNNLGTVNLTPQLAGLYARFPLSTRVTRTHDMFHTLLGCDATTVGELGTYAFYHSQGYSETGSRVYRFARRAYAVVNPSRRARLRHAEEWGLEQGRKAVCLIEQPLENMLGEDLKKLRQQFGIVPLVED